MSEEDKHRQRDASELEILLNEMLKEDARIG